MKIVRELVKTTRNVRDFFAAERVVLAPFVRDLKRYNVPKLRADIWAAANVTVLALAQGIAFAAIAGLPVVYGIVSTAVAAIVAPLFAGSRHTILGPTNATAFMLFSFFSVNPALTGQLGRVDPAARPHGRPDRHGGRGAAGGGPPASMCPAASWWATFPAPRC